METPITDKRIERLQYLFDNDAIDTEEIKELIELKELKKALSLSDVVKCACCNNLATHLRCQKCHDDEVFGLVT